VFDGRWAEPPIGIRWARCTRRLDCTDVACINPSLTISVLALACHHAAEGGLEAERRQADRCYWTKADLCELPEITKKPKATLIELTEQVRGHVMLRTPKGKRCSHRVQITLTTGATALTAFCLRGDMDNAASASHRGKATLTILKAGRISMRCPTSPTEDIALEASISGQCLVRVRAFRVPVFRRPALCWAWVRNRGLRDFVQDRLQWLQEMLHLPRVRNGSDRSRPLPRRISQLVKRNRIGLFARRRRPADQLLSDDREVPSVRASMPHVSRTSPFERVKRITYRRAAALYTALGNVVERFPEMRRPVIGKFPG